ncbi:MULTISPECIES: suppressor of fused domain protein [unclassified Agrococcus]|uniref:suppressor of fused domain protein n=1 Tax=unclassified Agrococcus TaxID=2615065 RepID=UPI00360F2C4C
MAWSDPAELRAGDEHAQTLVQHLRRHLGEPSTMLAEAVPDELRIDLVVFPPTDERPFVTLATVGMSALPMHVPSELAEHARQELLIGVPADWPGLADGLADVEGALQDEDAYWPIRLVKGLARYPRRSSTWVSWGHTVPSGSPFHEGVPFSTALIGPPLGLPTSIMAAQTAVGRVSYLAVLPITDAEMQHATATAGGSDDLIDRLQAAGVTIAVDPGRASVV